jgi:hypothetical protein
MGSRDAALQALSEKDAALRREEQTAQREKRVFLRVIPFVRQHPEVLKLPSQQATAMFLKFNPDLFDTERGGEVTGMFDGPMFGD